MSAIGFTYIGEAPRGWRIHVLADGPYAEPVELHDAQDLVGYSTRMTWGPASTTSSAAQCAVAILRHHLAHHPEDVALCPPYPVNESPNIDERTYKALARLANRLDDYNNAIDAAAVTIAEQAVGAKRGLLPPTKP